MQVNAASKERIVKSPRYEVRTTPALTIESVSLSDEATVLKLRAEYLPNWWILISPETFLVADGVEYKLISTEGINSGEKFFMPESGKHNFTATFPPLPTSVKSFDYIAKVANGWKILGVDLTNPIPQYPIPEELMGNWNLMDGSGSWKLGLYKNMGIYENRIWDYAPVQTKNTITLVCRKDSKEVLKLHYKKGKDGIVFFGPNPKNMSALSQEQIFNNDYTIPEELSKDWDPNKFIRGGEVVVQGYLGSYSPKLNFSKAQLSFSNTFKSESNASLINIAADGSFTGKIEADYPSQIGLELNNRFVEFFAEPGDTVTLYYDLEDLNTLRSEYRFVYPETRYMGGSALVNIQYDRYLGEKPYYDNQYHYRTKNVEEFDEFANKHYADVMRYLKSYCAKNKLLPKAEHLLRIQESISGLDNKLSYESQRKYWLQSDSTIQDRSLEIPLSFYRPLIDSLDIEDKCMLASRSYYFLVNRIQYFQGYYRKIMTPNFGFIKKYTDFSVDKSLTQLADSLRNGELIIKDHHAPEFQRLSIFSTVVNDRDYITYKIPSEVDAYYEFMEKDLGIGASFFREAIVANVLFNKFTKLDKTPSNKTLASVLTQISDPDITQFLLDVVDSQRPKAIQDSEVDNKISMIATEAKAKERESSDASQLLKNILKEYRNHVIVLDFWAMWCAPCKSGIKNSYQIKDALKDKSVKFVYFTTEKDSPKDKRDAFIKENNIEGEFITLTDDEWTILKAAYNISGIPRYMLLDRDANVVNDKLDVYSQSILMSQIDTLLAK